MAGLIGQDFAKDIDDYHEVYDFKTKALNQYWVWQSVADSYNNEIGRGVGQQCGWDTECSKTTIQQMATSGELLVIAFDTANPDDVSKWAYKWSDGAAVYWVNGRPSRKPPEPDDNKPGGGGTN